MLEDKPGPAFVCPLLYLILILKRKQNKASGYEQRGSSGCFLLRHQSERFVPNETIVCLLQIYEYLRHQLNYLFKKNSCDSTGFSILTEFSRLNFTQCNVNHAQQVVNLYEIFILPEEELCEPFRNSLSLI